MKWWIACLGCLLMGCSSDVSGPEQVGPPPQPIETWIRLSDASWRGIDQVTVIFPDADGSSLDFTRTVWS